MVRFFLVLGLLCGSVSTALGQHKGHSVHHVVVKPALPWQRTVSPTFAHPRPVNNGIISHRHPAAKPIPSRIHGVVSSVPHRTVSRVSRPASQPRPQRLTIPGGLPALNSKVLAFALAHSGQMVRDPRNHSQDGICHTLVDRALASAGARGDRRGLDGLENYGRMLRRNEPVLPGDIIEFKNTFIPGVGTVSYHVAIVAKVAGTKVTVLHQNVGGQKFVQQSTYDLRQRQGGKIDVFRPVPAFMNSYASY